MSECLHDGHRARLRARFQKEDGGAFESHELLELLLFYAIPRRDTNALAHRLLERFLTLDGVLSASIDDLMKVDGVGLNAATYIKAINALHRAREQEQRKSYHRYDTVAKIKDFLIPLFSGYGEEHLYMLLFDAKMRMLDCVLLAEGSNCTLTVNVRQMLKIALDKNASSVILAHNHPDGLALPSQRDVLSTSNYIASFDVLGITLLQHYVVADQICTPVITHHSQYGEIPMIH